MKTIICIDDEKVSLETLMLICEASGHQVRGFTNPIEALEYIKKNYEAIGLIFLDLMMPQMYGLNALRKIREDKNTKHTPVVINSCLSDPEEIDKISKFKDTDYVNKPFSQYSITSLIEKRFVA